MPNKSVLLVEDEANIAIALEFLLGRRGYRLRHVSDGNAAIDALAAEKPDLVILDVMLPHRSGYEICQHIRKESSLKDIKVLMMTARGGEVERRKGLALGADSFLTKPFATADLTNEISHLLGEGENG